MTIELSLRNRTGFTISPDRWQRIQSAPLDNVVYDDHNAVQKARAEIVQMGIWDTFVDDVFHSGNKQRALHAIATIILSAKADELHRCNRVMQLRDAAVYDAKCELVTLLSRDGALNFASISRDTGEGIEFFPKTGDEEFDRLLATSVFPYELAALLWEKANMHGHAARAWGKVSAASQMKGESELEKIAVDRANAQRALAKGHASYPNSLKLAIELFEEGRDYVGTRKYRFAERAFEMAQYYWEKEEFFHLAKAAGYASAAAKQAAISARQPELSIPVRVWDSRSGAATQRV